MKLSTDKIFYVYEWYDTVSGVPFYIGKGKLKRMYDVKNRSKQFLDYYNNHSCDVRIIKNNLSEYDAFLFESYTIENYILNGIPLVNKTSKITGGITHTKEELIKISNASKDMWKNPEYRKLFKKRVDEYWNIPENRAKCRVRAKEVNSRPEVILKQRKSHLGKVPYNKGIKMSKDYCDKMRQVLNRPETLKKMSKNNNSNKEVIVKNISTGEKYHYYNIVDFIKNQHIIENNYKDKRNLWRFIRNNNYCYNEFIFEVK